MMKKIEEIKKLKKHLSVKIGDTTYPIDFEIALKYHMSLSREFDLSEFNQMLQENMYITYYKLALEKLKKLQTRFEMKTYLQDKDAPESIIKQVILQLEKRKYIDDEFYVKTFINIKKQTLGPKMISYQLKQKGVDHDLINKELSHLNQVDEINHLISKKLKSLSSKSNRQKLINLKTYLLTKGFDNEQIDQTLFKLKLNDQDDIQNLKKDFDKLSYKLKGLPLEEKNRAITQKLYQKGYSLDLIKKMFH